MFHFSVFSIGIYKKYKSNHYLLLLAICLYLEITQFWSVNYICLMYKLKFLFWILDIRLVTIVFGSALLVSFHLNNLILV